MIIIKREMNLKLSYYNFFIVGYLLLNSCTGGASSSKIGGEAIVENFSAKNVTSVAYIEGDHVQVLVLNSYRNEISKEQIVEHLSGASILDFDVKTVSEMEMSSLFRESSEVIDTPFKYVFWDVYGKEHIGVANIPRDRL